MLIRRKEQKLNAASSKIKNNQDPQFVPSAFVFPVQLQTMKIN